MVSKERTPPHGCLRHKLRPSPLENPLSAEPFQRNRNHLLEGKRTEISDLKKIVFYERRWDLNPRRMELFRKRIPFHTSLLRTALPTSSIKKEVSPPRPLNLSRREILFCQKLRLTGNQAMKQVFKQYSFLSVAQTKDFSVDTIPKGSWLSLQPRKKRRNDLACKRNK